MSLLELLVVGLGAYCFGHLRGHAQGLRDAAVKMRPAIMDLKRAADQQLRLVQKDRP